jgi:hypothetical protein
MVAGASSGQSLHPSGCSGYVRGNISTGKRRIDGEILVFAYFVASRTRASSLEPPAACSSPGRRCALRSVASSAGSGETLFYRDRRSVRHTDAGEALLPHARAALAATERGRDAIDSLRVTLVHGTGHREAFEKAFEDAGFLPRIAAEAGELSSLIELAAEEIGAAIIPRAAADRPTSPFSRSAARASIGAGPWPGARPSGHLPGGRSSHWPSDASRDTRRRFAPTG